MVTVIINGVEIETTMPIRVDNGVVEVGSNPEELAKLRMAMQNQSSIDPNNLRSNLLRSNVLGYYGSGLNAQDYTLVGSRHGLIELG